MAKTRLKIVPKANIKHDVLIDGTTSLKEERAAVKKVVPYVNTQTGVFHIGRNNGNHTGTGKTMGASIEKYGEQIKECNLAGMSANRTAKQLDISIGTVTKVSQAMGLVWDGRIPEYNAMVLRRVNEERKQRIKHDLLAVTEKFVRRLMEPTYTLVATGATRIMVEEVPVVPGGEARDLSTAARNLMFVVERLDAYEREKERNESSTIDDWLKAMTGENDWNSYGHELNMKKIKEREEDEEF